MKISIENFEIHRKCGLFESLELIKAAGFDCVDFSYYWLENVAPEILGENYLDIACRLRAKLDELELTCNQAHAPFVLTWEDAFDLSNRRYLELVRSMESAAILGARQIVVHALTPENVEDMIPFNYAYYKSLEPYCKKFGIRVAVENLFMDPQDPQTHIFCDRKLGKPAYMNALMEMLDPQWFVICVDIGHARLTGNEPEDYIAGIDGSRLKALHVQDNDGISDRHILPWNGILNWDNITKSLGKADYDGEVTLEVFGFLGRMEPEMIPDALKFCAATARLVAKKIEAVE